MRQCPLLCCQAKTKNETIKVYYREDNESKIDGSTVNDIPSSAPGIEISGKDQMACNLFFSMILKIFLGTVLGFDMPKNLQRNVGSFLTY